MIVRDALRGEPKVDIVFDSSIALEGLVSVSVDQQENAIDVAKLNLRGARSESLAVYSGQPIHITYGSDFSSGTFAGYVASVEPVHRANQMVGTFSNPELRQFSGVEIVCLSAADRMRATNTRVWRNRTVTSIAEEIVTGYRYSAYIEPHDYRWPVVLQDGISDWAMLIKLAKMVGYRFTVSGTHMRFYDPLAALQRPSIVPTVASATARLTGVEPGTLTLREFKPLFTAQSDAGFSGEIRMHGVDDLGQSFELSTASLFDTRPELGGERPRTTSVKHVDAPSAVSTVEEGRVALEAVRREHAWPITADILCSGSHLIQPGNLINLTGFAAEYDGAWYVLSVEHTMGHKHYTCSARIGKDALGSTMKPRPNLTVGRPPTTIRILDEWVAAHV